MKDVSLGDNKERKNFCEKVIDIMQLSKMTYKSLAEGVGENVNTLKQTLYGRRRIKKDLATKICDYLGLNYLDMTKDDPFLSSYYSSDSNSFGAKLGKELSSRGITHYEFADTIGISNGTLSRIVNNKTDIKKDTLVKICSSLNLNIYDMIKDDPKYDEYSDLYSSSVIGLFKKVGIDEPVAGYENILLDLINNNKSLFLSNSQNNFTEANRQNFTD